ncbi:helix-turn-helix domain-containing protein [Neobacillus niacini]|uniref:helix-turn-helix domain-containing protein n=1 Tax=Neobacillus niacini TaxID=86668 RepID=UPI0007ABDE77|nr:helix-turn-helix domain-containing protein [Neobacillus niacini]MEC1524456.1 helix-turn-helix domain-containing protein [Neobacillus niacini]
MKQIPLTEDEKKLILSLHEEGKTAPEIAEGIQRHNSTVYDFFKKGNLVPNSKPDIFSENEKEQMKELYIRGESLEKISNKFNCSRAVIKNRLVKMGIKIREQNKKIFLPKHIINKIVDDYQHERCSTYELAERYGLSTTKITSILKENNIKIHPVGKKYTEEVVDEVERLVGLGLTGREIAQKLDVSEAWISYKLKERDLYRERGPSPNIRRNDYFDNIDSEDKAYFLGLLVADGCIRENYSIHLILQREDSDAVMGFTMYIGAEGKFKFLHERRDYPKWKKTYGVRFKSKYMYHSLLQLGVKPRKSGKEVMPDIPEHLVPHFIRGYFDGDGLTCVGPARKYSGFCGSKEMLVSIQKHLGTNLTIHEEKGTCKFSGGIQFSKELYDYMYSNATIWLDRKRRRMDIICNYSLETWPRNNIIPNRA